MVRKELMVGDIVNVDVTIDGKSVTLCGVIDTIGKTVCEVSCQTEMGVPLRDIHPIPLTEEILEANGFRKLWDYCYKHDDFDWYVCLAFKRGIYVDRVDESCYVSIQYVHELQHYLRSVWKNDMADNLIV